MTLTQGPICPNCRQPLRQTLHSEQITARGTSEAEPGVPLSLAFCGACGWTVTVAAAVPRRVAMATAGRTERPEVVAPPNPSTLAGQFHARCGELIREIESAGFTPGGWIGLINTMGAVEAAQHLLANGQILPVTRWLVRRGSAELTMESEIMQMRWADLFTVVERQECARRLDASVGRDRDR